MTLVRRDQLEPLPERGCEGVRQARQIAHHQEEREGELLQQGLHLALVVHQHVVEGVLVVQGVQDDEHDEDLLGPQCRPHRRPHRLGSGVRLSVAQDQQQLAAVGVAVLTGLKGWAIRKWRRS